MKRSEATVASAVAGLLMLATLSPSAQAAKDEAPAVEKCYGVAKAGKNDCQTKMSSCAGTSKQDAQKDAWISVPKGTCEKIVGGSLQAAKK
jgi:uncharacterized membrane protein